MASLDGLKKFLKKYDQVVESRKNNSDECASEFQVSHDITIYVTNHIKLKVKNGTNSCWSIFLGNCSKDFLAFAHEVRP